MNDPKYYISGNRLYHTEHGYQIPDGEPVMVLRGKDPIAIVAIQAYIDSHPDQSHRDSAQERMNAFCVYQTAHPELCSYDCSGKPRDHAQEAG